MSERMGVTQEEIYEAAMVAEHAGLARSIAYGYFLPGGDYDDVRQEAMVALLEAVREWDRVRNPVFAAFANMVIRRRLMDAVTNANRMKHQMLTGAARETAGEDGEIRPILELLPDPRSLDDLLDARARLRRLGACAWGDLTVAERGALARVVNGIPYAGDKQVDNALQRARIKLKAAA